MSEISSESDDSGEPGEPETAVSGGLASGPPSRWQRFWAATTANPTAVAALASAVAALLGVAVTLFTFSANAEQAAQAQYADRYTRAVTQLGDQSLEVRLGGIYALQRLSIDSPRDQPTVVNVLAAYARNHLPFANDACLKVDSVVSRGGDIPLIGSDVWATLDVLDSRDTSYDADATAGLNGVCLPGSYILSHRDLRGFDLSFINLDHANLSGVNLAGVHLIGADLVGADFTGANLDGADVGGAYMQGAKNADLSQVKGIPATLPG